MLINTARETVGEDVELMVDAGGSEQFWPHGVSWARETATMLGEYGVVWFEEALQARRRRGFPRAAANSPVLIASGEVLTRRQAFLPFITGRALDIIQPDLTKCGGLGEARRLGWLAYDHGVLLVPHGWNTAVGRGGRSGPGRRVAGRPLGRISDRRAVHRGDRSRPGFKLDADGMLRIPNRSGLGHRVESRSDRVLHAVKKGK